MTDSRRFEISILVGPCTREEAEDAALSAHQAAADVQGSQGPGTVLNYWDEDQEQPGEPVPNFEVIG